MSTEFEDCCCNGIDLFGPFPLVDCEFVVHRPCCSFARCFCCWICCCCCVWLDGAINCCNNWGDCGLVSRRPPATGDVITATLTSFLTRFEVFSFVFDGRLWWLLFMLNTFLLVSTEAANVALLLTMLSDIILELSLFMVLLLLLSVKLLHTCSLLSEFSIKLLRLLVFSANLLLSLSGFAFWFLLWLLFSCSKSFIVHSEPKNSREQTKRENVNEMNPKIAENHSNKQKQTRIFHSQFYL